MNQRETPPGKPECLRLVPSPVQAEMLSARLFDGLPDGAIVAAPEIDTLSAWVADRSALADLLGGRPAPASPGALQVIALWEAAVKASFPAMPAAERYSLASRARNAHRLLQQWDIASADAAGGREWTRFDAWRRAVEAGMQAREWHTSEDWALRLTAQLERGCVPPELLPRRIRLSGFAEFTALERRLLGALAAAGVQVGEDPGPTEGRHPPAVTARHSFETPDAEIAAAAAWAKRQMDAGLGNVAVIVNGLEAVAQRWRRIFENVLDPVVACGHRPGGEAPFRVSRGGLLSAEPLVRDALLLLDLSLGGAERMRDFQRLSRLLLSPNWSAGRQYRARCARLELRMRRSGVFRWSLGRVARLATRAKTEGFSERLEQLIADATARDASLHPAQQFLAWLRAWGWPGGEAVPSRDGPVLRRFLGLLEALSRQETADLSYGLERLERACRLDEAAGPGGELAPVRVITLAEAYGLRFDAAWLANLSLHSWPPAVSTSPFLSAAMLERVPRATEDGNLAYAERLVNFALGCADEVRASWCSRLDDLPVSASPLIAHLPELAPEPHGSGALWQSVAPQAARLDGYARHPWLRAFGSGSGLPLQAAADGRLNSAVRLLNFQSACPLAAYLVFRLHARTEPAPPRFPDAAWRGEVIHAALESLHRDPPRAGSPGPARVEAAVDAALQRCGARRRLLPVETEGLRAGLQGLLEEWLEFERQWPCGDIAALEWRGTLEIGGHAVDVRIDRVNRLPDGRVMLVDYKTGPGSPGMQWADDRPGDLQLPLYAVLLDQQGELEPAGVAVARVRRGEMGLLGLADHESALHDRVSGFDGRPGRLAAALGDWQGALCHWRAGVTGLLDEFAAGDCRHQVFRPGALRHADLELLLRSAELERWQVERATDAPG